MKTIDSEWVEASLRAAWKGPKPLIWQIFDAQVFGPRLQRAILAATCWRWGLILGGVARGVRICGIRLKSL